MIGSSKKIVLKESILEVKTETSRSEQRFYELDPVLVEKLIKSGQRKFSEKVQKFLQSEGKFPSILRDNQKNLINVIGCALTNKNCQVKTKKFEGNIICGACGDISYCRDVRKCKKFSTFLCKSCSDFTKSIESTNIDTKCDKKCVILASESSDNCHRCWTRLILLSCQLEEKKRNKLEELVEKVDLRQDFSPGIVFECVGESVAAPLIDKVNVTKSDTSSSICSEELLSLNPDHICGDVKDGGQKRRSVLHEQMVGGWSKKAVRRSDGRWSVFLLSPDMKILRTEKDLKIYVAKTGSILDTNLINSSLPSVTARMEPFVMQQNFK